MGYGCGNPEDRNGDYEPQLIKKYQNTVTLRTWKKKCFPPYAKGMTTGDIESHYVNYTILIFLTHNQPDHRQNLPIGKRMARNARAGRSVCCGYGCNHYHVHGAGRVVKRYGLHCLGIDMNGKKMFLFGMYVGENESAKFWLSIMNGLKNRGVEDILIAY